MNQSRIEVSHQPCPCGGSSDAYSVRADGSGFCFSCAKNFKGQELTEENFTYEYLPWRGVSRETMRFYNVSTRIDASGKPDALAAIFDNGAKQVRLIEEKKFFSQGPMAEAGLFGIDRFEPGGDSVTITEGWMDALSGYEILRRPCVSVRSSSSARKDCVRHRERLNTFNKIYLAFDNDEQGQKAAAAVAGLFDFNKVYHVKLTRKDANDYLVAGEHSDFRKAWESAGRYLPKGITSTRKDFHRIINEGKEKPGIPYPFPTLNSATRGLRTGECVLLAGDEGIGKTELLRAIEYSILTTTDYRIATIHMEETEERQLQGLASYYLKSPCHLPEFSISKEEVNAALDKILGDKEPDSRLHIYAHFDSDDPDIILDRIRFMVSVCGCRFVFLDHIGKLVSGLENEDERRKLDYLSTKIDQMARDLDFGIVINAHVNAEGRIRGSTYPSKIAAVWVHLDRDITAETEDERNKTYLKIKKNRFGQKTGPGGVLSFDPETFVLEEVGELPT